MNKFILSALLSLSIFFSTQVRADDDIGVSEGVDFEAEFYKEIAKEAVGDSSASNGMLKEIPTGVAKRSVSAACDPHRFEESILNKKRTTAEFYTVAKSYFKKCSSELSQGTIKGILGLVKFSMYQYQFFRHPQIKPMTVTLADGTKIPAILALKLDPRPRPLVILRCGVFCSAGQSATTKAYMMHLFDQSPFNVMILANQTGLDYLEANRRVSLGGWAEGYENLEVGEWMRNKWEGRHRISSMHLMGISLGGNAAVFGASFNDKYLRPDGQKIFKSVTAICPVISLRPTLDKLYSGAIIGRIFGGVTKSQFLDAKPFNLDVSDMISESVIPNKSGMADYIGSLASTSLQRRGIASTTESFYRSNNFFNLKEVVTTPLMVFASKDDSIVNNETNAQTFMDWHVYEKSKTAGVVNLSYGNHCGFASVYGFNATAAVLRDFVLLHSPEFMEVYKPVSVKWTPKFMMMPWANKHMSQTWKFASGSSNVNVTFKVFDGQTSQCEDKDPNMADLMCIREKTYTLSIDSLKALGARVPRNGVEAEALTREFNSKVEFRSSSGPINGTRADSFSMVAREGFE
jgi:hypothetical protein